MSKKIWICDVCGDEFSSKKKLIAHLKGEAEEGRDVAISAEEDVDLAEEQIKEVKT